MRDGVRQDPSAMQTLKLTDYEALRNETNFLAAVSPNVSSSGQLIAGNNNYPSSVSGVGTDYLEIRQLTVDTTTITDPERLQKLSQISNRTFNAAKIVVSTVPLLCIYPFLQKYFVTGITIGSVKG